MRQLDLPGSEVFKAGNQLMKRKEIRAEFNRLKDLGIVTVLRSSSGDPVHVVLNGVKWEGQPHRGDKRSAYISNMAGTRFIKAQAWAIGEVRRELKRKFRDP